MKKKSVNLGWFKYCTTCPFTLLQTDHTDPEQKKICLLIMYQTMKTPIYSHCQKLWQMISMLMKLLHESVCHTEPEQKKICQHILHQILKHLSVHTGTNFYNLILVITLILNKKNLPTHLVWNPFLIRLLQTLMIWFQYLGNCYQNLSITLNPTKKESANTSGIKCWNTCPFTLQTLKIRFLYWWNGLNNLFTTLIMTQKICRLKMPQKLHHLSIRSSINCLSHWSWT